MRPDLWCSIPMHRRILVGVCSAVVLSVTLGAQQPDYKALLARATQDAAQLHKALGSCKDIETAFLADQLMEFSTFRAKFEAANPGKSLDESLKVIEKH